MNILEAFGMVWKVLLAPTKEHTTEIHIQFKSKGTLATYKLQKNKNGWEIVN